MKSKKVAVAMSGGVDSSVAAALLQDKGYEVLGVTMNLFSLPPDLCRMSERRSCCGWRAIEDAHEVCLKLGISHLVADFRQEFEKRVVADFCTEYTRGRTPNPCIRCNEHIKFDLLLGRVLALGADFLATGHHSRIIRPRSQEIYRLRKGKDGAKDQSYFLYRLTQEQLGRILMPVGSLTKKKVREEARKRGLRVAEKPESQEICFVPRGRYHEFLRERIPEAFQPGLIRDLEGNVLGEHQGIIHFTIGQRRGLGVASNRRLYVVSIELSSHTVVAGPEEALFCRKFIASSVHWLAERELQEVIMVKAKIRYKHEEAKALVSPLSEGRVVVEFKKPQRAVTPGQSVVFYRRDEVLGGGIIDRILA